jgi:hypothetical protein
MCRQLFLLMLHRYINYFLLEVERDMIFRPVRVTLQLTVSRSVSQSVSQSVRIGTHDQMFMCCQTITGSVVIGRPP